MSGQHDYLIKVVCHSIRAYDALLAHHQLDRCQLVGRQTVEGPNWKVAYDGYLDFYHLPVLHRESFGSSIPSDALYDAKFKFETGIRRDM